MYIDFWIIQNSSIKFAKAKQPSAIVCTHIGVYICDGVKIQGYFVQGGASSHDYSYS